MKRSDRIFWGIYILWSFTNLTIFLLFGTVKHSAIKYFYPFSYYDVRKSSIDWVRIYRGLDVYDYTELIFYCLLPMVIFFAIKLLFPPKNK